MTLRRPLLLPCLLMLACTTPTEGTVVGNPGDAAARVAPVDAALSLGEGEAYVDLAEAFSCAGEVVEIAVGDAEGEVDLLSGGLALPGGDWCALGLEVTRLELEGTGPDGSVFELELEPGWIEVEARGGFLVDGDAFVLELAEPGWLTAELLGIASGGEAVVGPEHPLHDALADTVALRSALFADDGDGTVAEDERDLGPVAVGVARAADVVDTGGAGFQETVTAQTRTGCSGDGQLTSTAAVLFLGPGLLLGLRRRRD